MKPWDPCGTWHRDSPKSWDEPRHQHDSEQEPGHRLPQRVTQGLAQPEAAPWSPDGDGSGTAGLRCQGARGEQ